jgi:hypothetical protein
MFLNIDTLKFPEAKDFHIPVMIIDDLEPYLGIGLGTRDQTCNLPGGQKA